ncbi:P-loop containing nucleoside triphosphate hydrolase protein [Mycena maculata]|uniref:small monomeric GTPase n=1 Tax=Mycena maculata TaxID=230809 RepID=A0AAD7I840_9AGAR|nr:P-loop containing nucleoside triphosphate hydrolase protein [Mycena maculata]
MDNWRITFLGADSVGNTALATHRVCDPDDVDYRRQFAVDDHMCLVEIIDPREGQGFVLMYSITSRESFDAVGAFHQSIQRIKGENPIMLLVGTKCDKSFEHEVSVEEGVSLAKLERARLRIL